MKRIQVSIIVATYNSAKTLRRALNSVVNQSFQNWECIVVDGASKDNTIEIVQDYAAKDERFKYLSEPDKGIYDAFNKGWKAAKGEWILYLGSDDELMSDGISQLVENSMDADLVYGNTFLRKNGIAKLKLQISSPPKMGGFCCHQSLIMKRELILSLDGFNMEYKILADKDLICRAIQSHCKIKQIDVPVSIFSLDGLSSQDFKRYKESFKINRKYRSFIVSLGDLLWNVSKNTCRIIRNKLKIS